MDRQSARIFSQEGREESPGDATGDSSANTLTLLYQRSCSHLSKNEKDEVRAAYENEDVYARSMALVYKTLAPLAAVPAESYLTVHGTALARGESAIPRSGYRDLKSVNIRGLKAKTPREAASVFSAFRDPRVEIFNVAYTDGDGKILRHEAWTLGLPNITQALYLPRTRRGQPLQERAEEALANMKRVMRELGARKIWIAHNHPSGNIQPSREDIAITKLYLEEFGESFGGHIILARGEYSFLYAAPEASREEIARETGFLAEEAGRGEPPNEAGIRSTSDAARVFSRVLDREEAAAAVGILDASHRIIGWNYIGPAADIRDLRAYMMAAGGTRAFIAANTEESFSYYSGLRESCAWSEYDFLLDSLLVKDGELLDAASREFQAAGVWAGEYSRRRERVELVSYDAYEPGMRESEKTVYRQILGAFPALSAEEARTAVSLLAARAEVLDLSFEAYIKKYHPAGIAEREESLGEEYKGYVKFLEGDAGAIIRAGKSADFSTFVHEAAHVFRRQLDGELREKAERVFSVRGGRWTRGQEEEFALGLEEYIRTREERDEEKREVFQKGSRFIRNVYGELGEITRLTPEMEELYAELFSLAGVGREEEAAEEGEKFYRARTDRGGEKYFAALNDREAYEKAAREFAGTGETPALLDELDEEDQPVRNIDLSSLQLQSLPDEEKILFQTNAAQLLFDFTEGASHEEVPVSEENKNDEENEDDLAASEETETAEETPREESGTEPATPTYYFEPEKTGENVYDYTGMPANRVFLVSPREILTKERPAWIPPLDERDLARGKYVPRFEKDGSRYRLFDTNGSLHIVTPEIFAASLDYYLKRAREKNREEARERNEKRKQAAREELPLAKREVRKEYLEEILAGKHEAKPRRVTIMGMNRMSYEQLDMYKARGLGKREAFDEYIEVRKAINQKLTDMRAQLEEYISAYTKGAETSYGDSGVNPALREEYGVFVKRQNGDAITGDEIQEIRAAHEDIQKVYGDLKDISAAYGLKISHSGKMNMHARRAVGIFHAAYHTIGVRFASPEEAPFILAHEYAHFLDSAAGKELSHFFASDKDGTPEAQVAQAFRAAMNRTSGTASDSYHTRTCECFARAMEEYAAHRLSEDVYKAYCGKPAYCRDEEFQRTLVPLITTLIAEREDLWHPKEEAERSRGGEAELPEKETPREENAEKENGEEVGLGGAAKEERKRPAGDAQKYLALGGTEWQAGGRHLVYFNGKALKALYGLRTQGDVELSAEEKKKYRARYTGTYLPRYPREAFLYGQPIEPAKAFELLLSRPYYDVQRKELFGLKAQSAAQYIKGRRAALADQRRRREAGIASELSGEEEATELLRLRGLEEEFFPGTEDWESGEKEPEKEEADPETGKNLPNTPENYIENFLRLSLEPEYAGDRIEAARVLLRRMSREDREKTLEDLREKGCADGEATRGYLRGLLEERDRREALPSDVREMISLSGYLEAAFLLTTREERFADNPEAALREVCAAALPEEREKILADLDASFGWKKEEAAANRIIASSYISYIQREDEKTLALSSDGKWRIHSSHGINEDNTIRRLYAATDTENSYKHVSYYYQSLEEAVREAEGLTAVLRRQKELFEEYQRKTSAGERPDAGEEEAESPLQEEETREEDFFEGEEEETGESLFDEESSSETENEEDSAARNAGEENSPKSLEYNEAGVVVSPPRETVEVKNKNGKLTLSIFSDNGRHFFGADYFGKNEGFGSPATRRDSYPSLAECKRAAYESVKAKFAGERRKIFESFDLKARLGLEELDFFSGSREEEPSGTRTGEAPEQDGREDGGAPEDAGNAEAQRDSQEEKFQPYGAWTDFSSRLSLSEREAANSAALRILEEKKDAEWTDGEKKILSRYSGFGGLAEDGERGVLYDYYTSPPVADFGWRLLEKIGSIRPGASVLEPSCGTGVFLAAAPEGVILTGVELDARTAQVAAALHGKAARIHSESFERFNLSGNMGGFDHVIGNAPFGQRPADTAFLDMPEVKSLDEYFTSRALDNLKGGGTMALITAPGIVENKTGAAFRASLARKAAFMGAVKLPDRSFHHTHTRVEPVVLLFKKYPKDIESRLSEIEEKELETLPLFDADFAAGAYFEKHPEHLLGEVSKGTGQWGKDELKGDLTPGVMEDFLLKFRPREVNLEDAYEEVRRRYGERAVGGDAKFLKLNTDELRRADSKKLLPGELKAEEGALYLLTDLYKWREISRAGTLAEKIPSLQRISAAVGRIRERMRNGEAHIDTRTLQVSTAAFLSEYHAKWGTYPADDGDVKKLLREYPAVKGIYEAFLTPDEELFTKENLYDKKLELTDGHNPAVSALRVFQENMLEADEKTLKEKFPDRAEELIGEMGKNPDIFLSADGIWQLREDFISGDAWAKIDSLREAALTEEDGEKKRKWEYGAAELEAAVGWTQIEEAEFSPHSSWIPVEIIRGWVMSEDGLGRESLRLTKNAEGKWGRGDSPDSWEEEADPVVYYLNMQKQRSRYISTEAFNKEHTELFRSYIANHEEYRRRLEEVYNRSFRTRLLAPVKTYPVEIAGWRNAGGVSENGKTLQTGKTIKPHQWQTIHQLYRQGRGISALGTGFGKTLSGIGLMSLMRQEGKLHRVWLQVPNNKVKDWLTEIKDVMPHLKLEAIDPEEPGYGNREKRYAKYHRMASGEADIIIMPESSASEIQLSAEADQAVTELIAGQYMREKEGSSKRQLQTALLRGLEHSQNGKTNKVISFEDFGCDAIFVDEAHRYKNLFSSNLSRETGMNDGRQSAKAMALFKKTQYTRGLHDGKNVFLLTATPLTNSPLEYYNMLQFLAPEELSKFGISTIDGFIREFADIRAGWKYDWATGKAKEGKILTGFKNLETLQNLFFTFTDLQNDPEVIGLEKPKSENSPTVIAMNAEQTELIKSISRELEAYKSLPKEEREAAYPGQNFLTFYSRMRTASLDLELYDPDEYKDWKNPKLEALAKNARERYLATRGGQVVFCDRVFSSDASFNIHEKIKASLVAEGFKENEVIIVNGFTKSGGAKSDSAIEKEVSKAIEDYNNGKYKVIIGSTACIGEGVNLQRNSSGLHHFDIPFRPSDFIQRNGRIDRQGNEQSHVALSTYLAAGTIDNYSVGLVQNKANWIDQLLKTKSNVFTNPNEESGVDTEELLLALSEEWGDKEKAAERRAEMLRVKNEKILAARNTQRIAHMGALSLMRGAVQALKRSPSSPEYTGRMAKIHNIEEALRNNPTFTRNDILEKSDEPFLYNKDLDEVFRVGDILVTGDGSFSVQGFDFKKQELQCQELLSEEEKESRRATARIYGRTYSDMRAVKAGKLVARETSWRAGDIRLVTRIGKEAAEKMKPLISVIAAEEFYALKDEKLKEEYYPLHIRVCASRMGFRPVRFSLTEDGRLLVDTGYGMREGRLENILNPFAAEDKKTLKAAMKQGLEYPKYIERELLDLVKKQFPSLHKDMRAAVENQHQKEEEASRREEENSGEDVKKILASFETRRIGELPAARQVQELFLHAVRGERLPWHEELRPGEIENPFNPATGELYGGVNFFAAALHMSCVGTRDPRYIREADIGAGRNLKDGAFPLKISYRKLDEEGAYRLETETLYNASQIEGAPAYEMTPRSSGEEEAVLSKPGVSPGTQLVNDMAGFMRAVRSGRGFTPCPSDFRLPGNTFAESLSSAAISWALQTAAGMKEEQEERAEAASRMSLQAVGMVM